jgi:tRNA U34 5-methylaminomethyl-2-thiouridine-forming methyltransferase MnmC
MEMFIYTRMTDEHEKIAVKLLSEEASLEDDLRRFDAARAKCFLDRDRQKLLAIVETSFGTIAPFNALVRGIFDHKLRLRASNGRSSVKHTESSLSA